MDLSNVKISAHVHPVVLEKAMLVVIAVGLLKE